MTDLETRRYRNNLILSHAHELRKFINGCEDISFLADQVDCIRKFISDFANGVYDMELSDIPNMAALYKFFINPIAILSKEFDSELITEYEKILL